MAHIIRPSDNNSYFSCRALSRPSAVSRVRCVRCNARIPPARRRAVQGVQYCVTCQETNERKDRHDSMRKA
ncbi:TraR/DksA C4-type zinc finger protein [Candidatus Symbiopectobacterium sp.]|uniref:TraR/DksA C4-type zinc finger protein n=1 Tax=Candidatus Symbiopectobacterium sp. TaxID=2816440 RepID=UPI0025C6BA22|nr:TraR/DksA C4-type zinc finger protein [Candidatus Symbiopectobacterium sp.]